nr:site-specific DNA-methyltransferase [Salimicrobium jeotgali]
MYIEGDNLEVLKILQNSYRNKVKAVYIDPPYNTGKDFVYQDDFRDNVKSYKYRLQENYKSNAETNGRFHTDWLNMMYSRLKVARNLISNDGVIFISIDEVEFPKLRMICDEIFGEINHIADFVWKNKTGGGNDSKHIAVEHEYVVMYAKNEVSLHSIFEPYKPEYLKRYNQEDEIGKFYWDTFKRKSGKQYYPIECPDGTILEFDDLGNPISWLRSEKRFLEDKKNGEIKFVKTSNGWSVHFKQRLPEGKKPRTVFLEESIFKNKGNTSDGSEEILDLFKKNVFQNPKPINLVKHLISFSLEKDDIILDFFAGSATSAQAVMELNVEDNGKRRYILVQLPEEIDPTNTENQPAVEYLEQNHKKKNISEISKERIRLGIEEIKHTKEKDLKDMDLGFKVFELDETNLYTWDSVEENIEQNLLDLVDPLKKGRNQEDVVYEILLKYGVDLTVPIEDTMISGNKVYDVGMGYLLICLEKKLKLNVVEEIAKKKPTRVVFYDEGFKDDTVRINAQQVLKQYGVEDIRVI